MLGTGAWGYVAEGEFRGKRVAVKCLHTEIVASQTLERVQREIHTMAGIRQPSANLARCSQTLGEGAIIYSAPETYPQSPLTPNSFPQTTKIDVYSFGVLTGELLTEQFPNPASLPSTLDSVGAKWPVLHTLMVSCTKRDPLLRLDMDTIICSYIQPLLAPTAIAHCT